MRRPSAEMPPFATLGTACATSGTMAFLAS
jgi:hypothetical protein